MRASASMTSLKAIKAIVSDVDGVLTDGRLWMNADGQWVRAFHIQDGLGIQRWMQAGGLFAVISGSQAADIGQRFDRLGVKEIFLGVQDKWPVFEGLLKTWKLNSSEVAYIGDDLPDLPILQQVGRSFTVPEAVPEVLALPGIEVTERSGGSGAVREIVDFLLKESEGTAGTD